MGSKACIVILVMGIIGVVSMGLLTNFALSSAPQLKQAVEFKAALAKDLGPSVEEVSVKRLPTQGYQIVLTVPPGGDEAAADLRVARFFASNHSDRVAGRLEVARAAPVAFGCGSPRIYSNREFALGEVRQELAEETRREKLSKAVANVAGCRLISQTRKGGLVRVEVEAPVTAGSDLAALAKQLEPGARAELRLPPYTTLEVRITQPSGKSAPVELRFDTRGREIRASGPPPGGNPPAAPRPGAGGGTAPGSGAGPGSGAAPAGGGETGGAPAGNGGAPGGGAEGGAPGPGAAPGSGD